jgi:hypothetical protein
LFLLFDVLFEEVCKFSADRPLASHRMVQLGPAGPAGTGGFMMRRYSEDDDEVMKPLLPTVPDNRGPPTISLMTLIDLAVQRILHELTVLIEL